MKPISIVWILIILVMTSALPAAAQPDTTSVTLASFNVAIEPLEGLPVSLEELVKISLERNLTYITAQLSWDIAGSNLSAARGAFAPSYNSSSTLAKDQGQAEVKSQTYSAGLAKRFGIGSQVSVDLQVNRNDIHVNIPQVPDQTQYNTGLVLSFSQPILEGFRTANTAVRVAQHTHQAFEYRTERAAEVLMARIEGGYWALAEAEAVEQVRQRSVAVAQALLFRNTELRNRNLASDFDVFTAQSGMALRRSNRIDARRARIDAAEALIFLVYGETASQWLQAQTMPIKTMPTELESVDLPIFRVAETKAIEIRRDVEAVRQDLEGVTISATTSRNVTRPRLDAVGRISTIDNGSSRFNDAFGGLRNDVNWSIGLQFSNFLGNRTDRSNYEASLARQEQQRLRLVEVRNTVRQEVREAIRAVQLGRERLAFAEEADNYATLQLQAERRRLDLGLGDSFRVLQTEENRAEAGLTAVRARFGLARAITNYKLAMGSILVSQKK